MAPQKRVAATAAIATTAEVTRAVALAESGAIAASGVVGATMVVTTLQLTALTYKLILLEISAKGVTSVMSYGKIDTIIPCVSGPGITLDA